MQLNLGCAALSGLSDEKKTRSEDCKLGLWWELQLRLTETEGGEEVERAERAKQRDAERVDVTGTEWTASEGKK